MRHGYGKRDGIREPRGTHSETRGGTMFEQSKNASAIQKSCASGNSRWIEKFQAGEIKIETVSDLRELVEMDLSLEDK